MVLRSLSGQTIENSQSDSSWATPGKGVRRAALGKRLRKLYFVVLFSLLLLGGATFVLRSFHAVHYQFGWDDDEGAVWWETAHVTDLRVFYHPIQQYPYIVVPYPPVYHLVARGAAGITGDFLVGGRLVCVLSVLGISLIVGLLVFQASPRRISAGVRASGALLAALLCFRLDSLNRYIPEMGVDTLALLITVLGVFLFLHYAARPTGQYAAFACFVLALYTKQTMVAAPLACLGASAILSPRRALRFLVFSVSLGLAVLGFLAWQTDGEVLRHVFVYNMKQPFSVTHWIGGIQENLIEMAPIAAIACLALLPTVDRWTTVKRGLFIKWLRAGLESSPYRRAVLVLGMQLGFALLTSVTYGKLGSGFHYFLEWNLACCALSGLIFVRALAGWQPASRYTLGGAAVFLLLFLAALTGFPDSLRRINGVFRITQGERRIQQEKSASDAAVLRIIEGTPGPVLCENMVLAMKAHKEIPIEPGIGCFLARLSIWDQSDFVKMISSRRFEVIVIRDMDNGFWTDAIVEAIKKHYSLSERIGNQQIKDGYYVVYRPQPKPVQP